MRKKWMYATMLTLAFSLAGAACAESANNSHGGGDTYEDYSSGKQPGGSQFDYEGNYASPELKIDGKGDDAEWQAIKTPLATFGHGNAATVKVYRGDAALFFLFEVKDAILLTDGETNDDAVTRSDSIEVYIDTLADGGLKPQNDDYQINLGIHGKTRIMQGAGQNWGLWNGLIDYEVALNGTLNDGTDATDTGYSVEVMIPYSQINIGKEDTIAVAFGQVDKVNLGSSAKTDWDWYGWTYNGKLIEPQTPDNYILLDKDNMLLSRDEQVKANAEMAGYVADSVTGEGVEGATVTAEIGGETKTATTDASGYFSFKDVNPEYTYTVTVTKEGYIGNSAEYTRAELRAADGGRVLKNISLTNEAVVARTTIKGTVRNLISGAIGGATVKVEGTLLSVTSGADGSFEIPGVPVEVGADVTLVVGKEGFGDSKTVIKNADVVTEGEGITLLGDVSLNSVYAESGAFAGKSEYFADLSLKLSRTLTGVEFYFTGTRELSGRIELYVDTKECAGHRDLDATFWRFDLEGGGVIGGSHYAGGAFVADGLEYTVYYNDSAGYASRFFVPYGYLGIDSLEVFGISLGQWSTTANDWDGWGFAGQFVAPETPETLIRFSAENELYRANSNISMVNLSGNAGMQGVRVTAGEYAVTTGADGSWAMKIPQTSEAVRIVYTFLGYNTVTTDLEAGYFAHRYSYYEKVNMTKQTVSLSGTVTDSATNAPVEGVTVTVAGTEITVVTDAEGKYALTGVSTEKNISVRFEKEGYASQTKDFEAAVLASSATHTQNISLVSEERVTYVTLNGSVTNVNGGVSGVTVVVDGTEYTATTDAEGKWSIRNFKGVDSTLTYTKEGYISQTAVFKAESLAEGATQFDMGGVDMPMQFVSFGALEEKSDETKRAAFAGFTGYTTRTASAIEIKFIGTRAFANGQLEVYFDLGASDARDYQFNIFPDGSFTIVSGANKDASALKYSVKNAETAGEVYLTIPYSFFGISPAETIGIGAGQWSTAVNDWDPLFQSGTIVEVGDPATYVRLASDNDVYRYTSNEKTIVFSGNAGEAGVTVTIGGASVLSGENGAWSLRAAMPSESVTIHYTRSGYISQTQTVEASALVSGRYTAASVTLVKQEATISGTVTDSVSGAPLKGVTVSVDGTEISTVTDAEGKYTLTVGTAENITLKFVLDNYTASDVTKTAEELAAAQTHTVNSAMVSTEEIRYIMLTGEVTNVNGPVSGAVVTVEGNSDLKAVTDAQGRFEISGYALLDGKLTVTKDGFISAEIPVTASAVEEGANAYDCGIADMPLEYKEMSGLIADKSDDFGQFKGYVTRSAVGFEFKFIGSKPFKGRIELFVDTKTSAGDNARDLTDYLFNLNADGTIVIVNWGDGQKNETVPEKMKLTVKSADTKPEVYFTLPYAFFGQADANNAVTSTEVIGISLGQYNGSDWDGWDNFALTGENGAPFVKPEMPADYIRIAADNTMYAKADNQPVDFSSYRIHFATGENTDTAAGARPVTAADDFYGKVSGRDVNGVTFEFITTGDFGKEGDENEMVLIYFDTGDTKDGWENVDYLIKIASDGTVYGKAGAWWSASEADKIGTVAITRENGVTTFSYTVSYDLPGIGANDVFGIAMREASHNATDHHLYDPWYDCYFEGDRIDAAASSQYVRVAADGTMYKDNNNNPDD